MNNFKNNYFATVFPNKFMDLQNEKLEKEHLKMKNKLNKIETELKNIIK